MKTYVASLLKQGDAVPQSMRHNRDDSCESVHVFFETDESYIIDGAVMSAAQAARELGLSPGRITHMIDAGILDGYRDGRRTYVAVESVERRKAEAPQAGRPPKAMEAS
ncbi:MAG: helix-turn-helix domain-containing protein, partial [Raoultibacter sp.]